MQCRVRALGVPCSWLCGRVRRERMPPPKQRLARRREGGAIAGHIVERERGGAGEDEAQPSATTEPRPVERPVVHLHLHTAHAAAVLVPQAHLCSDHHRTTAVRKRAQHAHCLASAGSVCVCVCPRTSRLSIEVVTSTAAACLAAGATIPGSVVVGRAVTVSTRPRPWSSPRSVCTCSTEALACTTHAQCTQTPHREQRADACSGVE